MQGTIRLSDGRVTVGPHGKISADVDAREVIVRGKVKGAVHGRDRVEVGRTGEIRGDILTSRLAIEEGAQMHSKVEITRAASLAECASSGNLARRHDLGPATRGPEGGRRIGELR